MQLGVGKEETPTQQSKTFIMTLIVHELVMSSIIIYYACTLQLQQSRVRMLATNNYK